MRNFFTKVRIISSPDWLSTFTTTRGVVVKLKSTTATDRLITVAIDPSSDLYGLIEGVIEKENEMPLFEASRVFSTKDLTQGDMEESLCQEVGSEWFGMPIKKILPCPALEPVREWAREHAVKIVLPQL